VGVVTERRTAVEHVAPWLGMLGAAAGWAISQQVGSDMAFDDCRVGDGGFVLIVGLIGLLVAAAGGYFSWDVWRRKSEETEGRRFIGLIGLLLALLTGFGIVLQSISGLILPSCAA
jgi:TRAP-type C4-dicarboxylate transport system permease small subunit